MHKKMQSCVKQKHVGVPGCWDRATAEKTVAEFREKCNMDPKLSVCQNILESWDMNMHSASPAFWDKSLQAEPLLPILRHVLDGWNKQWTAMTSSLVEEQRWDLLPELSQSRAALQKYVEEGGDVTMADPEKARMYLQSLKKLDCFDRMPELDTALAKLL